MKEGVFRKMKFAPTSAVLSVLGVVAAAGCSSRPSIETATPAQLSTEVRSVLGNDWRSPEYHNARNRLRAMGPEVDSVLVSLAEDAQARTEARADALVLLADRQSPLALPVLERALQYDHERLRGAAVQGLSLLSGSSNLAVELIRRATLDRSRTVRMHALQSLYVQDVETVRTVLAREVDPEVRQVALQIAILAEARGAPLARDARGAFRTSAADAAPQIVFRPVHMDDATGVSRGDLRLELHDRPDIPLSASATAVNGVVPAFFAPDRSAVVVEDDGVIRVVDVNSGNVRTVGPGLAPRPVPFTYEFLFLREVDRNRSPGSPETMVAYEVYQTSFGAGTPQPIGQTVAVVRGDHLGGESPVRTMVVAEFGDGFVLRAQNFHTFAIPIPVWGAGRPNGPLNGGYR